MRQNARVSTLLLPSFHSDEPRTSASASSTVRQQAPFLPSWLRTIWIVVGSAVALGALVFALLLLSVRFVHEGKVFPNVESAGVSLGGLTVGEAANVLEQRASTITQNTVAFIYGDTTWTSTYQELGASVDVDAAMLDAMDLGREPSAYNRLQTAVRLARGGSHVALPARLDFARLDSWFDTIDQQLGAPPRNASVEIQGTTVQIMPEVDGLVVDRAAAREDIIASLQAMEPMSAALPTTNKIATIRTVDLEPAQMILTNALSHPVQVSNGSATWTLPTADLATFLTQSMNTSADAGPSVALGLDQEKLATWLNDRLAAEIEKDPVNAEVGWNGERVVSIESSVDGVQLDAPKLAELVEAQFFGAGGTIVAPLKYTKPEIDSGNLGALKITRLLGSGQSNYSGSNDGRSTNVANGASRMNGTLVPPWSDFSFNNAVGVINEENGFVEAQVIDGEAIGKDIGGGICQVSTTVFRAAYLAGLPITEWWPHRFRIGFYEYDDWAPGLDASILQPTEDPSTWADFRFENPSDSWMLVESWTDGVNVVVNIYGADLGYDVESTGPVWGNKLQMLGAKEVVDEELDPGTVSLTQVAGIGEELSHNRVVRDRNGELLWERNFYTKYYPRGDIWSVSPDMKGQAPIDPSFQFPPLPPAGIDSHGWTPGMETPAALDTGTAQAQVDLNWVPAEEWTEPTEEWTAPEESWTPPAEEWTAPAESWTAPTG